MFVEFAGAWVEWGNGEVVLCFRADGLDRMLQRAELPEKAGPCANVATPFHANRSSHKSDGMFTDTMRCVPGST